MPARVKAEGGLDYIRIKSGGEPAFMIAGHIETKEEEEKHRKTLINP